MYAWLAFWLAGAALAFCIASRTHKPGWWIIFAFSSALAQYTHTLAVFFLIPLAMIPLWRKDWRNLRAVTLAGAGALLLFLPWLVQVPAQIAKVQTSYWMEPPGLDRVFSALTTYVTNLPLPDGWLVVGLFVTLSTFSLLTLETAKSIRRRDPYSIEISWFAYMAIAPLVLLLLFSQWIPVFTERALLPSVVFFCLWAGGIIAQARGPRIMKVSVTACLLIGAVIGIYQHLAYTGFPYVPRSASTILQDMQSGDAVVHSSKLSALPMIYQQPALTQRFVADPPDSDSDTLSPATLAVFGLSADPQVDEACHGADRVWFVIFTRSVEEYREAGADTHPHMEWLASHFIHQSGWVFSGLEIHLFSMNP